MSSSHNINIQQDSELKKISELFIRNYKLFTISVMIALLLAFLINRYSIPLYKISSSILIKENENQRSDVNDFLNSSLLGNNRNFQNEMWVIKSSPVLEQTAKNVGLEVSYFYRDRLQYKDIYNSAPFEVSYLSNHPQPVDVRFNISIIGKELLRINAESKKAFFLNYESNEVTHQKNNWVFSKEVKSGDLVETSDLAFIIKIDSSKITNNSLKTKYSFMFRPIPSVVNGLKGNLEFKMVDRMATVIEIGLKSESLKKGIDIVNELMNVYSEKNLERKNHNASITIDYIEKQLNEISDSLSLAEDNLQNFRSSNQLLNISDQATGISSQYMNLQNQLAEMVSRKKYYDYVSDLLAKDNFSNMMLPASIGISDPILNTMMSELITAQAQRANLIQNNQERNPLVQKLNIQIENAKKTISDNIASVAKTTSISIEDMNKRIRKIESEISQLPLTQRQLGSIERKYRLNDAIYNYLLEKRAEAKITKASNLPDNIIIESAKMVGSAPIKPNKKLNYLIALLLGLSIPYGYLTFKSVLNNRVESQDDVEQLTTIPILGKIMHNRYRTSNLMYEFPKSNIAESFRALRTNLDFYVRGGHKKVILVTSCLEGEGKSFIALNLAMSYAQLGRKTILIDFDLRKPKKYFNEQEESTEGLSSFMINKSRLEDIVANSPHEKLDYIPSGILPPNPVELIALEQTEKLLKDLREDYDIIVLDTTPLAQVIDAYLLFEHADLRILITRYKYTLKNVLSLILKDLDNKKISNACIVLNDNRIFTDQYGYGYGYYSKGKKKNGKNSVKA